LKYLNEIYALYKGKDREIDMVKMQVERLARERDAKVAGRD